MNTITVVGSINQDTTLYVQAMPKPGETIRINKMVVSGGGKGANQAIAAQRLGAKTAFIGAVGADHAGEEMLALLRKESIDVAGVAVLAQETTGQAFISVDAHGENSIMINAGANTKFDAAHVRKYRHAIKNSDFVIVEFESPVADSVAAFEIAHKAGVKTILNPAPALKEIPTELLALTDLIVPNETETEILTGIKVTDEKSMTQAAAKLISFGVGAVVITLGSRGVYYHVGNQSGLIPALKVKAVDTTAAGDTFIGAVASVLRPDFANITEALAYGNRASALTVQKLGAQNAIPFKPDLD